MSIMLLKGRRIANATRIKLIKVKVQNTTAERNES